MGNLWHQTRKSLRGSWRAHCATWGLTWTSACCPSLWRASRFCGGLTSRGRRWPMQSLGTTGMMILICPSWQGLQWRRQPRASSMRHSSSTWNAVSFGSWKRTWKPTLTRVHFKLRSWLTSCGHLPWRARARVNSGSGLTCTWALTCWTVNLMTWRT